MAALKLEKLKELIKKSYVAGYNGMMEMADEFSEEMIQVIQQEVTMAKTADGDWRVYTVEELRKKEGEIIREIGTLNRKIAGRTPKEYYKDNKELIKKYYEKNKDKYKELGSNYLQKLKEENPEKLKEYRQRAYQKRKEKVKQEAIILENNINNYEIILNK